MSKKRKKSSRRKKIGAKAKRSKVVTSLQQSELAVPDADSSDPETSEVVSSSGEPDTSLPDSSPSSEVVLSSNETRAVRNRRYKSGPGREVTYSAIRSYRSSAEGSQSHSEAVKRYKSSDKGSQSQSEAVKRYKSSAEGSQSQSEAVKRYKSSDKGSQSQSEAVKRYHSSDEGSQSRRQAVKRYHSSAEGSRSRIQASNKYKSSAAGSRSQSEAVKMYNSTVEGAAVIRKARQRYINRVGRNALSVAEKHRRRDIVRKAMKNVQLRTVLKAKRAIQNVRAYKKRVAESISCGEEGSLDLTALRADPKNKEALATIKAHKPEVSACKFFLSHRDTIVKDRKTAFNPRLPRSSRFGSLKQRVTGIFKSRAFRQQRSDVNYQFCLSDVLQQCLKPATIPQLKKVAKMLDSEDDSVGRSNLQLKLHVVRQVQCRIVRQRETLLKWFGIAFARLKAVTDDITSRQELLKSNKVTKLSSPRKCDR